MAGREAVEADIDLFQLDVVTHQLVHRQHAAAVEVDVAGDVAGRYAGAHVAALDGAFFRNHVDVLQRPAVIGMRQAG